MGRLTRNDVLAAAVELADEEGLGAVSLRRLADRLGVTAMALYRHVRSKEDLLDGMAERLYGELDLPDPGIDWWEGIAGLARSWRALLLARPWAASVLTRPFAGPHGRALDEALGDALRRAGFSASEARELHHQLSGMVMALIAPERAGRPNRAAFERGLELLHAGLEARRSRR